MWQRFKNWCRTTWKQLDNWQTLVLFIIVCAVVYSPVWVGYLLYFLFHFKWAMVMATSALAFWAAPFTPFFPLCISITLAIKKFFIHLHQKAKQTMRQIPKAIHNRIIKRKQKREASRSK